MTARQQPAAACTSAASSRSSTEWHGIPVHSCLLLDTPRGGAGLPARRPRARLLRRLRLHLRTCCSTRRCSTTRPTTRRRRSSRRGSSGSSTRSGRQASQVRPRRQDRARDRLRQGRVPGRACASAPAAPASASTPATGRNARTARPPSAADLHPGLLRPEVPRSAGRLCRVAATRSSTSAPCATSCGWSAAAIGDRPDVPCLFELPDARARARGARRSGTSTTSTAPTSPWARSPGCSAARASRSPSCGRPMTASI